MMKVMRNCGRSAQQYLDRRGLPRPAVDYRQVAEFKHRAKELGID